MDYDPIPDIQKLGYTFREASFLYLVGIHSGYFLRRQFNRNIQRELGALSQQFLEKADGLGHVRTLEYRQKRHVFHLTSKPIYYLLSDEIPPYQRLQRDQRIKMQLMILDYVLDHPDTRFLPKPSDKLRFFGDTLRLSRELLPQKSLLRRSAKHHAQLFCRALPGCGPARFCRPASFDFLRFRRCR